MTTAREIFSQIWKLSDDIRDDWQYEANLDVIELPEPWKTRARTNEWVEFSHDPWDIIISDYGAFAIISVGNGSYTAKILTDFLVEDEEQLTRWFETDEATRIKFLLAWKNLTID